jgi:hypothetical protein
MVTNCSGERLFSLLKPIKNEWAAFNSATGKAFRLSIMRIESGKLRSLSFQDMIGDFALEKSRKKDSLKINKNNT